MSEKAVTSGSASSMSDSTSSDDVVEAHGKSSESSETGVDDKDSGEVEAHGASSTSTDPIVQDEAEADGEAHDSSK